MRLACLLVLLVSACTTEPANPASEAHVESVRDRLARGSTRLLLSREDSAGTITARRKIIGGWQTGLVDLAIDQGALVVSADPETGGITIEALSLTLEDIPIPRDVFDRPAWLSHARAMLAAPARVATTWITHDDAHLETELELTVSWALTVDGITAELGGPQLPAVRVAIELGGNGGFVHAHVKAGALGELWSWAGLVKLEDLNLVLTADTR
ncbi:MAG TPA: hypothetical protein VK427_14830 [Kofleriaceae bacterium]|nr:hypothetical protein [Kofleriaceae bacterium]